MTTAQAIHEEIQRYADATRRACEHPAEARATSACYQRDHHLAHIHYRTLLRLGWSPSS